MSEINVAPRKYTKSAYIEEIVVYNLFQISPVFIFLFRSFDA